MRYRILDLETIGHPDAEQWCDPVKPDARCTKPESIAKSIEEKTIERRETFALDPDCNRIVALGWHDVGYRDPKVMLCKDEIQEAAALTVFWETYRQQYTKFVTFNGQRFDLPVLVMRSIYLDVDYPEITIAPAWKSPHVDLWQKLSLDGARKDVHSLAFYARRLGIGTLDKVKGSDIAQLVKEEKWAEVEAHCLSDLGLTHALANRLRMLKLTEVPLVAEQGAPF